jgi:hypothetical protein
MRESKVNATRAGLKHQQQQQDLEQINSDSSNCYYDQVFDRKVDLITAGLRPYQARSLRDEEQVSRHNAMIICDYMFATNIEVNPSPSHRRNQHCSVNTILQVS